MSNRKTRLTRVRIAGLAVVTLAAGLIATPAHAEIVPYPGGTSWALDRIDQATKPTKPGSYKPDPKGKATVHVFVLDSGISTDHPEFKDPTGRFTRAKENIDYVAYSRKKEDQDAERAEGKNGKCNGHGTGVASAIGGARVGVAPEAMLHSARVRYCSGEFLNADIAAEGVDWVVRAIKADKSLWPAVINISGSVCTGCTADDPSARRINAAVNAAIDANIPVVLSAGNRNTNVNRQAPAMVERAITVGATTVDDVRFSESNWGQGVDVFAPGAGVLVASNHPQKDANGKLIFNEYEDDANGTSFATAYVTGAVVLYLQKMYANVDQPQYSETAWPRPADVQNAIVNSATRVPLPNGGGPLLLVCTKVPAKCE